MARHVLRVLKPHLRGDQATGTTKTAYWPQAEERTPRIAGLSPLPTPIPSGVDEGMVRTTCYQTAQQPGTEYADKVSRERVPELRP